MKKILWISPFVPYDGVVHAGGKSHNYQIKYFRKTGEFDIHLITLAEKGQEKKIDLDKYGISYDVEVVNSNKFKDIYRMIYNIRSMYDTGYRLCQTILAYQYDSLKKRMYRYARNNNPDIVIMQWTGTAFLLSDVKKLFPKAKTVIIEEDVSFLGYRRKYKAEKSPVFRARKKKAYLNLKKRELEIISGCDIAVVNNIKDYNLLLNNGIEKDKMVVVPPYFKDYSEIKRNDIRPSILFYGVMSREENHGACMWFINNVMPLLDDTDLIFEVIGSNPKEELLNLSGDRIMVRGFVEDVGEYLSQCLCMVVPLFLGAGIKVKVLEGLSAGVPVLASPVGLEGIPAEDGKEIFCCRTSQDYVTIIRKLYASETLRKDVSDSAKDFIKKTYNINERLDCLIEQLA